MVVDLKSIPIFLFCILCLALPQLLFASETTTLKASLDYALAHNRALKISAHQADAAQAKVDVATGQLYPQIDVATGIYRSNSALNTFGSKLLQGQISTADFSPSVLNNPAYVNNYQSRLGLTLPLYSGGSIYAARHQALANAEAAALQQQFYEQQLIYKTIVSYVQARQTLAQASAKSKAVQAAQQRLKDAKALKKRGMAIESDVMDAHVYVLRSQLALDDAQNKYANSVESLRLVLGVETHQRLGQLEEPNIKVIKVSLDTLLSQALQNRADYLALLQQEEAAASARTKAESGYMPQVNLTASREWNAENFGLKNGNNSLGLTVSMNLFAGGADRANIRAAESARIGLSLQRQDKQQHIQNEIRQAWRSFKLAEKMLRSESEADKDRKSVV